MQYSPQCPQSAIVWIVRHVCNGHRERTQLFFSGLSRSILKSDVIMRLTEEYGYPFDMIGNLGDEIVPGQTFYGYPGSLGKNVSHGV